MFLYLPKIYTNFYIYFAKRTQLHTKAPRDNADFKPTTPLCRPWQYVHIFILPNLIDKLLAKKSFLCYYLNCYARQRPRLPYGNNEFNNFL